MTFLMVFISLISTQEGDSSPASGSKEDQIKKIESKLSREKQKLEAFDSRERDILALLADLEREVAEKRKSVEALGKNIRRGEREVKKLKRRRSDMELSLGKAESQMAERLVALYKYARRGYFRVLANAEDLDQFWQRAKYLRAILEEDRKSLLRLAETERKYKKQILMIREQLAKKEENRNNEEMRLAALRGDLEKKVIDLMKIHKEKEFYETAVAELRLAARNVKQTLLNIEKKETYETLPSARFSSSKGKLPFPIEGKIIRGDKRFGSGRMKMHKGVFIVGTSDAEVKAVFPGRVDFSGRLKGYGEVVIINHGSRFFTITAHLSQRKTDEGAMLEKGEIIGIAGRNESAEGGRLYFEIRKAGITLDPLKWLKVK